MLTIRPARLDDLGFVLGAVKSLTQMCLNIADPPISPATRQTYLEMLKDTDRHHMVVAQNGDGQQLGLAFLALCKSFQYGGWIAELQELFILNSARGTGVGRALMKYVDDFAKEKKLNCIILSMLPPGSPLDEERNLFYKRNGYKLGSFG
jgi:GNAT superfamily N-acetyltransferase